MTPEQFHASLHNQQPPAGLSPYLEALWHERRGDWDAAHKIVQEIETSEAARIHAYLHRREGDESNAGYWYRLAAVPFSKVTMDEEWAMLVAEFLR